MYFCSKQYDMEIEKKLYADIKEYCKINGLKIGEYINGLLKEAFMKDKFGSSPFENIVRERNVNKKIEVKPEIIEKIEVKEIHQEKPKEKVIVEKPVEEKVEIHEKEVQEPIIEEEVPKRRKRRLN